MIWKHRSAFKIWKIIEKMHILVFIVWYEEKFFKNYFNGWMIFWTTFVRLSPSGDYVDISSQISKWTEIKIIFFYYGSKTGGLTDKCN